ncbi:3-hydroxybenzoate 6-hydroxylase [Actinoplanes lobatus]|uniref:3-hydroxybenzoate 6-hydroxylase n=1 Tax=Actinoplanes lobatus TaxID=113568 RepID=A0A7W7HGI4_9ACTN|nr:FAD-dependent oxidoreductase [Actinoplanes lobatus]MBB4750115.1 salicylate hydroxylase [Actinoplanes lobatus]GGN75270.1 3-hydroxybenzoate 6-hydroxylase [Actinoplanes lobatus]GIE38996.1 3-hydroxybenzoate 6-hydroxylase [Actinoplanes lobatus]
MTADVVVVGGGIGGLATALALSRSGLRVRVLEQAPRFGEVGAGMQIAPNCTRILHEWGLLDEVKSLGVLPENIVMKDAVDAAVLTRLDLHDVERRYGFPYLVIHRSDLHGTLLRACERAGVELLTDVRVDSFGQVPGGAVAAGHFGRVVIAADGLHSTARRLFSDDEPVDSAYVAYRGAVPIEKVAELDVHLKDVVVYVGPACHLVQYPLRGGDMFNQVAVFRSPGAPDGLDAAFDGTCARVRAGLPLMWRDRWWRMYDREPLMNWVQGRIALTGDAAHPPLQYLAQGAVMAIEDAWVLASSYAGDWDAALAAYDAVRPEHCRRVLTTARAWGGFWHHDGEKRVWRNRTLRDRDVYDYTYIDWLFGPTALTPGQEPAMFPSGG